MTPHEWKIFAIVAGSILAFGVPAILALAWAIRDGQFDNLQRDAASIFDPDEPPGEVTDTALMDEPLGEQHERRLGD